MTRKSMSRRERDRRQEQAAWNEVLADMVRSGVLEIVGKNERGEPIYRRTDRVLPDDAETPKQH